EERDQEDVRVGLAGAGEGPHLPDRPSMGRRPWLSGGARERARDCSRLVRGGRKPVAAGTARAGRAGARPRIRCGHRLARRGPRVVHLRRMQELPRGTVTFLFTDIEGSTRLLRELGDDYATVL